MQPNMTCIAGDTQPTGLVNILDHREKTLWLNLIQQYNIKHKYNWNESTYVCEKGGLLSQVKDPVYVDSYVAHNQLYSLFYT